MDATGSASVSNVAQIDRAPAERRDALDLPRIVDTPERPKAHGSRWAKVAVIAADAVTIAVAMAAAAWLRMVAGDTPERLAPLWLTAALSIPVWLIVFARYKLYSAAAVSSLTAEITRITHATAAAAATR